MILVNRPTVHLTVKAQVYITGIEGVWPKRCQLLLTAGDVSNVGWKLLILAYTSKTRLPIRTPTAIHGTFCYLFSLNSMIKIWAELLLSITDHGFNLHSRRLCGPRISHIGSHWVSIYEWRKKICQKPFPLSICYIHLYDVSGYLVCVYTLESKSSCYERKPIRFCFYDFWLGFTCFNTNY